MSRGQGWAYTGAILGGVVSIAANVAHSYVPPEDAAQDWSPQTGAVIGAVFWPLALFVAIEILAKVAWRPGAAGWCCGTAASCRSPWSPPSCPTGTCPGCWRSTARTA